MDKNEYGQFIQQIEKTFGPKYKIKITRKNKLIHLNLMSNTHIIGYYKIMPMNNGTYDLLGFKNKEE